MLREDRLEEYEKRLRKIIGIKNDSKISILKKKLSIEREVQEVLQEFVPDYGRSLEKTIFQHISLIESENITVDKENTHIYLHDLIAQQYKMHWLVPGEYPLGAMLYIAAKPKSGKTFYINYLTRCVVQDGYYLGNPIQQGNVIWFQLEESTGSVIVKAKQFGFKLKNKYKVKIFRKLDLYNDFTSFETAIEEYDAKLVVIDTIRSAMFPSGLSEVSPEFADVFYRVQALAIKKNILILCLHHTLKGVPASGDKLDSVAGHGKLTSIADGTIILERKEKDDYTYLHWITRNLGRKTQKLSTTRDKWRRISYELVEEIGVDSKVLELQKQILFLLANNKSMTLSEIKQEIKDEQTEEALDRLCDTLLVNFEIVEETDDVKYSFPEENLELWSKAGTLKDLDKDIELANKITSAESLAEISELTRDLNTDKHHKIWTMLPESKKLSVLKVTKKAIPDNTKVIYKGKEYNALATDYKVTDKEFKLLYTLTDGNGSTLQNITKHDLEIVV